MTRKKLWGGISVGWLFVAGAVWALMGNLSSCTDLPSQIYYRPATARYLGVDFKNDTAINSATWTLHFDDSALAFDTSCGSGRVTYASEIASHGCSTSDVLSAGNLAVSISGCTSALPTRTSYAGLFSVCYKPVGTDPNFPGGLDGTCTAHNNSSGDRNCAFSHGSTTVADVFMSTTIPATVSSNSGQMRMASLKLGTDETLYSAYFSLQSTGLIQFADTSNTACCSLLRGGGGGCPDSGLNVTASVADTAFPSGCFIYTSAVGAGGTFVYSQIDCSNGKTQAGTSAVGIVKFCYKGAATGDEVLTTNTTATPFTGSDVLAVDFPSPNITVTP